MLDQISRHRFPAVETADMPLLTSTEVLGKLRQKIGLVIIGVGRHGQRFFGAFIRAIRRVAKKYG